MSGDAYLIYDGECPFCSRYVRLARLQKTLGGFRLIDARQGGPEVENARARGLVMDEGFLLHLDGKFYHGAECIHRLALMSSSSDIFNKLNYAVFRSERRSRILYPLLRTGRNAVLRLLGRQPMGY